MAGTCTATAASLLLGRFPGWPANNESLNISKCHSHQFRFIGYVQRAHARCDKFPIAAHQQLQISRTNKIAMSGGLLSFGQLVIGPPGSGKSTYCKAMKEFLTALGRKVAIVNLDPANEALPYEFSADLSELITLHDVMEKLHLGPNGSLIYCMEYLEKNMEWLKSRLDGLRDRYFLFDCPGQVELYTHHCSVRNVAHQLEKWKFKVH